MHEQHLFCPEKQHAREPQREIAIKDNSNVRGLLTAGISSSQDIWTCQPAWAAPISSTKQAGNMQEQQHAGTAAHSKEHSRQRV